MSSLGIYAAQNQQYPLDIVTGASRAYSLRKLKSSWNSPLINIRRSSDNATTDVNPDSTRGIVSGNSTVSAGGNLTTWAGASTLFVTRWYDQSGNASDMTQGTNANQPTLVVDDGAGFNHQSVIHGSSGSGQFLQAIPSVATQGNYSIISITGDITTAVFNPIYTLEQNGATSYLFDANFNSIGTYRITIRNSNNSSVVLDINPATHSILNAGFASVATILTNSSTLNGLVYQNNTQIYSNNSAGAWSNNSITTPNLNLFSRQGSGEYSTCSIPEFILYNSALSVTQFETIMSNQRKFFGF